MPKDSKEGDRGYDVFDIEYFQKQGKNKNEFFSEIRSLSIVEGLTYFLKDNLEDKNFNYLQFIKDATEIQEIRGLLYEKFNNCPKLKEEADNFHYKIFRKIIEDKFKSFVSKYKLFIDID